MTGLVGRVSRWWYAPAPAERLGVLRAAIGLFALWHVYERRGRFASGARGDADLFDPVGVFRVLGAPLDPGAADAVVWTAVVSGGFFVLGVFHRWMGPVFGVSLALTLMYRNSWSMVYHSENALLVHVLVLGFTRSAAGFSVDRWLAGRAGTPAPAPDDAYGWPIRLMCAVTVAGYFLCGFAKVVGPQGLGWASGLALREQIGTDAVRKEVLQGGAMPLAYVVWEHVWLVTLIGVGTLVLELGAPIFLFGRRMSRVWALSAWAMHWGIYLIMGIQFRYHLAFIIFLPFFDVERVAYVLRRAGRRGSPSAGTDRPRRG